MRQVPWFEDANPEEFYPRCYRLSHEEEKSAFIGKITVSNKTITMGQELQLMFSCFSL